MARTLTPQGRSEEEKLEILEAALRLKKENPSLVGDKAAAALGITITTLRNYFEFFEVPYPWRRKSLVKLDNSEAVPMYKRTPATKIKNKDRDMQINILKTMGGFK